MADAPDDGGDGRDVPDYEASGSVNLEDLDVGELVVAEFISKFNGDHQMKLGATKDVMPGSGRVIFKAGDGHQYEVDWEGRVVRREDNLDYGSGARLFATVPVSFERET